MKNLKFKALLTGVLCITLLAAGCGSSQDASSDANESQKEDTVQESADTADMESADAKDENSESVAEESSAESDTAESLGVSLSKDTVYDYKYSDTTDDRLIMKVQYDEFTVSTDNSDISDVFDAVNEVSKSGADEFINTYGEDAESAIEEYGYDDSYYTYEHSLGVKRLDNKVISVYVYESSFAMGAHGYAWSNGYNYDTKTGQLLEDDDIFAGDNSALADGLEELLLTKYDAAIFFNEDVSEDILPILEDDEYSGLRYIVGQEGIEVIFNPYDIAHYAAGAQQVTIPWGSDLLNNDYAPEDSSGSIEALYNGESIDVSSTGRSLEISWWEGEYGDLEFYFMYDGDYENAISRTYDEAYNVDAYVLNDDGSQYLWLNLSGLNDYQYLCIFPLVSGQVFDMEDAFSIDSDYGYGFYGTVPLYGEEFRMYTRTDLMGTLNVYDMFTVGDNGIPSRTGEWLYQEGEYVLTLKEDLEAEVLDDEDADSGKTETLSSGETFTYFRNDGESIVDLKASDGRIVRIYLEKESDDYYLHNMYNGENIEDIFDGIVYAG